MTGDRAQAGTQQPEGIAGYVTPYPYLDQLQEKMEERLARKVPIKGRFCGFCFARLRESDTVCPFCASAIETVGTVDEIPQDVLKAYKTKQKTEGLWVHSGAFSGLLLAMALFLLMVVWGPGLLGHPALAFAVLIGGGYIFAQLFGTFLGAQIGYRKGARKRDALWARWLQEHPKS